MTITFNRTYLTHGVNVCYTLELAGYKFDDLYEFWGNKLIIEKDPSGQTWYDRRQVDAFINA